MATIRSCPLDSLLFLIVNQKGGLVETSEIPLAAGPWFSEAGVVACHYARFLLLSLAQNLLI